MSASALRDLGLFVRELAGFVVAHPNLAEDLLLGLAHGARRLRVVDRALGPGGDDRLRVGMVEPRKPRRAYKTLY